MVAFRELFVVTKLETVVVTKVMLSADGVVVLDVSGVLSSATSVVSFCVEEIRAAH